MRNHGFCTSGNTVVNTDPFPGSPLAVIIPNKLKLQVSGILLKSLIRLNFSMAKTFKNCP